MSRARKNFIQEMHMKKGALHKSLHVPQGEKIPAKKLNKAAHSSNPTLRKRAVLAKTLKKLPHKMDGGMMNANNNQMPTNNLPNQYSSAAQVPRPTQGVQPQSNNPWANPALNGLRSQQPQQPMNTNNAPDWMRNPNLAQQMNMPVGNKYKKGGRTQRKADGGMLSKMLRDRAAYERTPKGLQESISRSYAVVPPTMGRSLKKGGRARRKADGGMMDQTNPMTANNPVNPSPQASQPIQKPKRTFGGSLWSPQQLSDMRDQMQAWHKAHPNSLQESIAAEAARPKPKRIGTRFVNHGFYSSPEPIYENTGPFGKLFNQGFNKGGRVQRLKDLCRY